MINKHKPQEEKGDRVYKLAIEKEDQVNELDQEMVFVEGTSVTVVW